MYPFRILFMTLTILLASTGYRAWAQHSYTSQSVLASGNWFRISISTPGVYRVDCPFLQSLGINTQGLKSASIRLYGNGGQMLPEHPGLPVMDDLVENAIQVMDGGDGIFDGQDYFLFFAPGPHTWLKDSANQRFIHQRNLYEDRSYYYLTIGGEGKRMVQGVHHAAPNQTITRFTDRYFYELDTVNLLSSGRQWFGEEFSEGPGKTLHRSFSFSIPGIAGRPVTLIMHCLARSFGSNSHFAVQANQQPLLQVNIPSVGNGVYDAFARDAKAEGSFIPLTSTITIDIDYAKTSANAQGWLNWLELFTNRELSLQGVQQLLFRDWSTAGAGKVNQYLLQAATPTTQVWDVTDPLQPLLMRVEHQGNSISFVQTGERLHEFIAFQQSNWLTPVAAGRVMNQNLHQAPLADLLIITHPSLLPAAQQLAQYHQQQDQLRSLVITTEQIYHEFASGTPGPAGLRNFVKMYYDKANGDPQKQPKYLLLLGDASFDYRSRITNNTNLVPAYESHSSLDPLTSYTSDDFFGLLDDGDDINGSGTYQLDIGIGRIPAANEREATAIVNKIIQYHQPTALGPWRNTLCWVADDEDNNLHLQDAEVMAGTAVDTAPVFNQEKIYLDAFPQESASGGSRYPLANQAIQQQLQHGTLIWNYSGHGGYRRLAEEVVLDQSIINSINNTHKLPLFITATCDVAPFDNPLVQSIGENLLLREKTGAIALMTTTRIVYAYSNRDMDKNYLETALQQQPDGRYLRLGDAVRKAKNKTYTSSTDVVNNRKFTLLGDPALTLAFPAQQVTTTAINGVAVSSTPDTLKALSTYTISGVVTDRSGQPLTDFNGTIYPVVFDKAHTLRTLANDPGSTVTDFPVRKNILFKGKATVQKGGFQFSFVVPRDINYKYGAGRISYYTEDGKTDGNGLFTNIIIGGSGNGSSDQEGPVVSAYLDNEKFISGGICNERPLLLLKLADSSGINIMGTGIGHDLVVILDHDPKQQFVLNAFYESDADNFRKGMVRFQLPTLTPGLHTLTIKAWDAANNSSEVTIECKVMNSDELVLDHVLNYPNPFTTHTNFWFEHNHPGEALQVSIQIYTVSGKLVKTIRRTIYSPGNRSCEVEWDGRDEYGSRIGRGVYIYRLRVQTLDGKAAFKLEKLFIL